MAKKLQLDSLLGGSNKSSGIRKIEERSEKSKQEPVRREPVKQEPVKEEIYSHTRQMSTLPNNVEVRREKKKPRGRPKVYKDPRYVSSEPARISMNVKIKLQSLADQKFDSASQNQVIDELIQFYIEQALPKEEQIFIQRLVETGMEEAKSSKKYRKFFYDD